MCVWNVTKIIRSNPYVPDTRYSSDCHLTKSSSLLYHMSFYTRITHNTLARVWSLRATWMSYDVIPRDWAIHRYIPVHTCIHAYIYTYIPVHTYMHTYIHTYQVHTYIHTYISCQRWAIWAIIQQDHVHIHACLPGVRYRVPGIFFVLQLIYGWMFSGDEL